MTDTPAVPATESGFPIRGSYCITLTSHMMAGFLMLTRYQLFFLTIMVVVATGFVSVMVYLHGGQFGWNVATQLPFHIWPIVLAGLFFPHLVSALSILRMPLDARTVTFTISEQEIITEDAAQNRLVLQWAQLKKVRLWKNYLYLEFRTRGLRMLPARAFNADDFARLTAFALSRLPK